MLHSVIETSSVSIPMLTMSKTASLGKSLKCLGHSVLHPRMVMKGNVSVKCLAGPGKYLYVLPTLVFKCAMSILYFNYAC